MCKDKHLFVGGRIERNRELKRMFPKSTFISTQNFNSRKKINAEHIFIFWQWCDHQTVDRLISATPENAQIHYIRGTNMNRILEQVNEALN